MTVPKVIKSPLSQVLLVEGHRFEVGIYRDEVAGWFLEIVNEKGSKFVCDEWFSTDADALGAAIADFENQPIEDFLG
ncbi:hypothetical protein [Cypionkella sp. TWP1-2-1b2]|uniref:hypothetical protein n=1 Tax=Cypionkella sp. TWP1-2-1b2 TaxID=2804675 RepID=UPI003CF34265